MNIYLSSTLLNTIIGCILTGLFAWFISYRSGKRTEKLTTKNKKEILFVQLTDYLVSLHKEIINANSIHQWVSSQASKDLWSKLDKLIPLLKAYGNKKIQNDFSSLTCKMLSGIFCKTEYRHFLDNAQQELNINSKGRFILIKKLCR